MTQKIKTPQGEFAPENMDGVMLLFRWARYLEKNLAEEKYDEAQKNIIIAGIGWPTLEVSPELIQAAIQYWMEKKLNPEAIGYSLPEGDLEAREIMARALKTSYNDMIDIDPNHLVFTVGGAEGIRLALEAIDKLNPQGKILTPNPYYTRYNHLNNLYSVDCMHEKKYRLTARALQKSIRRAKEENIELSAFLFCDPNNPTGNCIGRDEFEQIAEVLRTDLPNVPIIIDEAYAEMAFNKKHVSLLEVAPDLIHRMILLRSGTKGLSVAGLRFAVACVFDTKIREEMITILGGPSAVDHQLIYAKAMEAFVNLPEERERIVNFYRPKVEYVVNRLRNMGIAMPDPDYFPDGAFYVMTDLSDLFDTPLPESVKSIIEKSDEQNTITSDIDIAYSLLLKDYLMLSPLSIQGVSDDLGYLRITCSAPEDQLKELLDRLEIRLQKAYAYHVEQCQLYRNWFNEQFDQEIAQKIFSLIDRILDVRTGAGSPSHYLRLVNSALRKMHDMTMLDIKSPDELLKPLIDVHQQQLHAIWVDVQNAVCQNSRQAKAAKVLQDAFHLYESKRENSSEKDLQTHRKKYFAKKAELKANELENTKLKRELKQCEMKLWQFPSSLWCRRDSEEKFNEVRELLHSHSEPTIKC